jgi:hypothetical protein
MTRDFSAESTERARAIADAVRQVELPTTEAWSDLDVLSSNTHIEAVEVFEDEIRESNGKFQGPINIHVTLQYPENVTLSDTFPGRFEGEWKQEQPVITRVAVDTSSFYA